MIQLACLLFLVFAQIGASAGACEVTPSKIAFGSMGTHTAWYCKATAAEKKQALAALAATSCVPAKLKAHGRAPLSSEATDVIPYWYTKPDAEKAGPILDLKITLTKTLDAEGERSTGIRALATGKKAGAAPTIAFELAAPQAFERACPSTGCAELSHDLCDPRATAVYSEVGPD